MRSSNKSATPEGNSRGNDFGKRPWSCGLVGSASVLGQPYTTLCAAFKRLSSKSSPPAPSSTAPVPATYWSWAANAKISKRTCSSKTSRSDSPSSAKTRFSRRMACRSHHTTSHGDKPPSFATASHSSNNRFFSPTMSSLSGCSSSACCRTLACMRAKRSKGDSSGCVFKTSTPASSAAKPDHHFCTVTPTFVCATSSQRSKVAGSTRKRAAPSASAARTSGSSSMKRTSKPACAKSSARTKFFSLPSSSRGNPFMAAPSSKAGSSMKRPSSLSKLSHCMRTLASCSVSPRSSTAFPPPRATSKRRLSARYHL